MKIKTRICFIILFVELSSLYTIKSQVTIGSASPPNKGTLLDMKENDNIGANSTKGLLLPRVELAANNILKMYLK